MTIVHITSASFLSNIAPIVATAWASQVILFVYDTVYAGLMSRLLDPTREVLFIFDGPSMDPAAFAAIVTAPLIPVVSIGE